MKRKTAGELLAESLTSGKPLDKQAMADAMKRQMPAATNITIGGEQIEPKGRWCVHYDSIPHGNCPDSEHCDCDCDGCVNARNGLVIHQTNREEFIKTYRTKGGEA